MSVKAIWDLIPRATTTVDVLPAPPRGAPGRGDWIPIVWGTHLVHGVALAQGAAYTGSGYPSLTIQAAIASKLVSVVMAICQGPIPGTVQRVGKVQELLSIVTSLTQLVGLGKTATITYSSPTAWTDGIKYEGFVQFRSDGLTLDDYGRLPDITWEVQGREWITGNADALPMDVADDIVTDTVIGLGRSSSDLVMSTGLDGSANSSWERWCLVHGFRVSRGLESPVPAKTLLEELATATASAVYFSASGKITFVPLGDTSVSGNGYTWTPPSAQAIGTSDLLRNEGKDPVQFDRRPQSETYNLYAVSFTDRDRDYETNTVDYLDAAHASTNGIREAPVVSVPWVTTSAHAHKLAQLMVRRSIYQRNVARFRLAPKWARFEPGDIGSLTDGKVLTSATYRLVRIDEDEKGELDIEALEWANGASNMLALSVQTPNPTELDREIPSPMVTTLSALARDAANDRIWWRGNNRPDALRNSGSPVLVDNCWTRSTAYAVGDRVSGDPVSAGTYPMDTNRDGGTNAAQRVYKCVTAGTSAATGAGPTGTGTGITDNTCTWDYVEAIATAERLKLWCAEVRLVYGTTYRYYFRLEVQPRGASGTPVLDNLDGLLTAKIDLFTSGAATPSPIHYVRELALPFTRAYYSGTHTDAKNGFSITFDFPSDGELIRYGSSPYNFNGYTRLTIKGVGGTTYRDFDATALVAEGYASAGGWTLGGAAPPAPDGGGGGDDGGGYCPAATVPILTWSLSGGCRWVLGKDLSVGDLVWTLPDPATGDHIEGPYAITALSRSQAPVFRVTCINGAKGEFSAPHRVWTGERWAKVDELQVGTRLAGGTHWASTVKSIESAGEAEVVRITVAGAQTYLAGGILSHNMKPIT